MLLLWFYLSGIALLMGAELNAEIEHASPYGKDVGEKVPGEKKRIGAPAEREYEKRKAKGEVPIRPFPDDVNCDIEQPQVSDERAVRPSELLIGAAALLPAAVRLAREVRKQLREETPVDHDEAA